MKRITKVLLVCAGLCSLQCMTVSQAAEPPSLILTDHPLAGSIYDLANGQKISRDTLIERLQTTRYVLLGETHDNLEHHENQARFMAAMADAGRSAAVSFEMIDDRQGEILQGRDIKSAQYLINLLLHVQTGWDYQTYYREVFDAVIQAGFAIKPANIERTRLVVMMHQQHELPLRIQQILSATPLTKEMETGLLDEIVASHCGMLDAKSASPMINGQRIRDAGMTASLLDNGVDVKILIAGNGHVRKDRGVPLYLRQQDPGAGIASLYMLEVEQDHNEITDYEAHWDNNVLPYDYVWFTSQADREDPCADWGSGV
jgi:uncharacterized iron-regulated protein